MQKPAILASEATLNDAILHLSAVDPILSDVIANSPPCSITPHANYFQALCEAIVGQQLSVKAAATIRLRFRSIFWEGFPLPANILEKSVEELRAVGLSYAKAKYILDLAQHVYDGRIAFQELSKQSNEQIIEELCDVKGIGIWTVHMFLIFCVGRLNVLPSNDLGIRNGIAKLYGLESAPTPLQIADLVDQHGWQPYESVASWYIWRSLDNAPAE